MRAGAGSLTIAAEHGPKAGDMSAAPRMSRGGPIRPRHPTFDLEEALAGDWHGGSPFRTAFFNAMSLSFPSGERFFIDAVREHEDGVDDPALKEAIRGFIGQEAVHRRVHAAYNETFCRRRGYDLDALEAPFLERIGWGEANLSPLARLATTVALEHLTATLAASLLASGTERERSARSGLLAGADPRVAELWRWHAVEELEHRSVAFDVYAVAGGDPKRLRQTLKIVTLNFLRDNFRAVRAMLRHDGHGWGEFAAGMWDLFGWPGLLRRLVPKWAAFLSPGFDPSNEDDAALVGGWRPDPAAVSFAPDPAAPRGRP